MFYVVSFDGCGIDSPLQSRTAASALALAEEAVRNGCRNVVIQVPGGPPLSVDEFAERYCPSDSPPARSAAGIAASGEGGSRGERRDRHAAEVEASQDALRESIAATEELVEESDRMLRRHRRECDDEEEKASG
jgi:hypothetical protein